VRREEEGDPSSGADGLSISPVTANFGDQAIQGETAATTFTVINNGPNTSGTIGVTVEGTNADNFSAVPDNCSEKTLDVGDSCTVDVKFAPLPPPGQKDAEFVVVSSEAADGTAKAALTGNAT
jgi:predicted TIM-barrel enzyme